MKKHRISALTAALLLSLPVHPASAAEIMDLQVRASQTAVSTDQLAQGDFIAKGSVVIEHYSGIAQMRLILKSDDPLVIENGDFTRVSDVKGPDGNAKLALFKDYSTATYTQYSAETGRSNVAVWYGPETGAAGGGYYGAGELDNANAPLLQFDLRIPKGTPVGDYTARISTDVQTLAGGALIDEDSYAYLNRQQLVLGTDWQFTPLTFSVYTRGDVNCDGQIALDDAQRTLLYYVEDMLGIAMSDTRLTEILGTSATGAAQRAADVTEDGSVNLTDAQGILIYYVESLVGTPPRWDDILPD